MLIYYFPLLKIDDDLEKYESIISSRRMFDDIKLMNLRSNDNHVTEKLRNVLEKYQHGVKSISIYNSKLPESHFIELLGMHLNLKSLLLYDVSFNATEKDDVKLYLPNLKSLNIQLCNIIISRTILRIPNDTLNSLSINNLILDPQTIKRILQSQKNIKELEFDPYFVDPALMRDLKFKKLKLMSNRNVIPIIKDQHNLTSLDLSRAHITDADFLQICKMKNLKVLKLWIDRISWDLLENVEKISKLAELALNYERLEVEYIATLSRLCLNSLQVLKIEFPKLKIFSENFIAISLNCPNVKKLIINCQSIGVIGTIIEYFKNLQCLIFECDSDSVKVVNFPLSNFINLNLKELYLHDNPYNNPAKEQFQSTATVLNLINSAVPNLERLKIINIISLDIEALNLIFEKKANLSHVHIDDISINITIDIPYVKVLKEVASKLDYIELNKVVLDIDEDLITQIMDNKFSYISCKKWKNEMVLRNCLWNVNEGEMSLK